MGFDMEAGIFLAYAAGLMVIFVFGKLLLVPLKKLIKFIVSSIIGGLVLVIINSAGAIAGIMIPVNVVTAMITGLLGLPGIVGLIIFFNV